jgi:sterol desaturase/sphingolipid hydroxylase (fatty acid hydroxylase superfamily)
VDDSRPRPLVPANLIYLLLYVSGAYTLILWPPASAVVGWVVDPFRAALPAAPLKDLPTLVQCVIVFVAVDLTAYAMHRAAHGIPLLWRFHRLHHSDADLGPFTTFRFHFVEIYWRMVAMASPLRLLDVNAASMPVTLYFLPLALEVLAHSAMGWTYGPAGRIVVSPDYHSRHHSASSGGRGNYSMLLPVWDSIFRTRLTTADDGHYGLAEGGHEADGFLRQTIAPLIMFRTDAHPSAGSGRSVL